jgi:hypothetical protein
MAAELSAAQIGGDARLTRAGAGYEQQASLVPGEG